MQKSDSVIAVAGWEDRFALGLEKNIAERQPSRVVIVAFEEYLLNTAKNRARVKKLAEGFNVEYREVLVRRREPAGVWKTLQELFHDGTWTAREILVDVTTMPREVIWWSLGALLEIGARVTYVYHQPQSYAPEWVTRDTESPRLVYQNSGVSELGRETCLLLISGFDSDRVAQMIQFFEPVSILIGLQVGEQFGNQQKNIARHRQTLANSPQTKYFDVNAYGLDHGLAAIDAATVVEREKYNIVAASLGPKLSAIALFELRRKYTNLALAYAPSRQFNASYSSGIGEAVWGELAAELSQSLSFSQQREIKDHQALDG